MVSDPEEAYDRSESNSAVVANLRAAMERLLRTFPDNVVNLYKETLKCEDAS